MAVFRPRTRLVNFRLSEDEYQQLKDSCARSGARSVSDYARAAVLSGTGLMSLAVSAMNGLACEPDSTLSAGFGQPLISSPHPSQTALCLSSSISFCGQRWDRLEGSVQAIQDSLQSLARGLSLSAAEYLLRPTEEANSLSDEERAPSHG